jgi:hypothetical protein
MRPPSFDADASAALVWPALLQPQALLERYGAPPVTSPLPPMELLILCNINPDIDKN